MYAIIVGGGRVGKVISSSLLEIGHEVLVIEQRADVSNALREELGSVVMCADGWEGSVLAEAGAERADLLIAVTEGDEDNLVACQVAHHRFGVERVIARVNNPKNVKLFKALGIEATVNAVESLADRVLHEVPGSKLTHMANFHKHGLGLLGVRIPPSGPSVGLEVSAVPVPEGIVIVAVLDRDGYPHVASDEVILQPDDEVIAIVRPELEAELYQAFAG